MLYTSYVFHFIYFLVKHICNIHYFYALDVIIGRHTRTLLLSKDWPSTHTHTYEDTHTKETKKTKVTLGKKRREISNRIYYIISPRVIIQAIIIIAKFDLTIGFLFDLVVFLQTVPL